MNTHDPAFRRAFRRGKKFYGECGMFAVAYFPGRGVEPGLWLPVPWIIGTFSEQELATVTLPPTAKDGDVLSVHEDEKGITVTIAAPKMVKYWNPDGKRWRRFDAAKVEKIINA